MPISRYLINGIRERFDLKGTPIRLQLRQTDNPFARKELKAGLAGAVDKSHTLT